ncbi:polymorphic toxin type 24 domain-containing protein [Kineococcus rhizosphaerae]|uniref:Putative RNase toxin 24 of polymorphic toxin system n=1 Tax=Kineococcus rhizosphaerae TaxID=559628 RepID=A0A2T0R4K5_9ACTN|nr:polymorphic toxin type 24 domain-containing protein [Kineococcus rhizosphaerae]PRY15250.1 putative RNase toxin 24 of polymorphic toxin system [Kineococcus rhizosphaerae]
MTDLNPLHLIGEVNRQIGGSTASVLEFLGITDTLVDPDGVRDVARAWQDLGNAVDAQVSNSYLAVLDVTWSGDTPAAVVGQVEQARTRASSVATQLHDGAASLRGFADEAHRAIVEIGVIAAEIIEWEAVGLALDVVTAGLATCVATIAAGARALRIVALVERIGETGAALLRTLDELAASVRGLGAALRALRGVARAGAHGAGVALGADAVDLVTASGRVHDARDVGRDVLWGAAGGVASEGLAAGVRAAAPGARALARRTAPGGRPVPDGLRAVQGDPWRGNFPQSAGPGQVLVRRDAAGRVTHYQVYDGDGLPIKRVDVTGRSHGGVDTPHVVEFGRDLNPETGEVFVKKGRHVRPATPDEVEGIIP